MTPEQDQRVMLLFDKGKSPTEISYATSLPRTTVRDCIARRERARVVLSEARLGRIHAPVRPLSIEVPKAPHATVSTKGVITALLYGDTHIPYQDDSALSIVRQIAALLQPALVAHMGDLLDCTSISRFDKDPARLDTLQDEIDRARVHLAQTREYSPASRFVLLEGNHEDRLRRLLWGLRGEAAVLNKLVAFNRALTWPALLGLDDLGVEFVPYGQASKFSFLPKFLLKHGDLVRQYSAYTAKGEMEKYSRSGASGHTHRLGAYYRADHNGSHVWIETGCTCDLNPSYVADPNWQSGCVVLSFDQDTGAVAVEAVHIYNGLAVWRGNVLRA